MFGMTVQPLSVPAPHSILLLSSLTFLPILIYRLEISFLLMIRVYRIDVNMSTNLMRYIQIICKYII